MPAEWLAPVRRVRSLVTGAAYGGAVLIIDSHCHAWTYWPYEPPVPDPESRGLAEQLVHEMDLNGVQQATIVSAQIWHNPTNNDYIAESVRRFPTRLHQYADVDSSWRDTYHAPGAAQRLEDAADRWPIKGFTHYLSADDDGKWMHSPAGIEFFRIAAERRLIASIACYPHQQPAIRRVAERFSELPILCHHMSGLKISEPPPHKSLAEVIASASLPNIYLKLSGFHYLSEPEESGEYPYSAAMWLYRACYEAFGPRMCWGSDYPVVRGWMTYRQALEAFRRHCNFVSAADRDAILGGTLHQLLQWARDVRL